MTAPSGTWTSPCPPVKLHLQDNADSFCGPASLMMILESADSSAPLISQSDAYTYMHQPSSKWDVSPDQLAAGLIHFKSIAVGATFSVMTARDATSLAGLVVSALATSGSIPPAILTNNCMHWAVVASVTTSIDPTNTTSSFRPSSFTVNDPQPVPNESGLPPHRPSDLCGTGYTPDGIDYSSPMTWFYTTTPGGWVDSVTTGKKSLCSGECVGVFSSVMTPVGSIEAPGPSRWTVRNRRVYARDRIITADEARAAAVSAVEEYLARPADAVRAGSARLVQELDRPESFYYIVALYESAPLPERDGFVGVIRINAWDGEPASMSSDRAYEDLPSASTLARRIAGAELDPRFDMGTRLIDGTYAVSPVLVWRRCLESLLPFRPFYQVTLGGRVLLCDAGGTFYETLTDVHVYR